MALIQCQECGKEVSDSAKVCPNCGHKNPRKLPVRLVIMFLLIIIVPYLMKTFSENNQPRASSSLPEATDQPTQTLPEIKAETPPKKIAPPQVTYLYEPETVTLQGTLHIGSGPRDGKYVPFFSLQLPTPITVQDGDNINETEKDVTQIQMILNDDLKQVYLDFSDKPVMVTGTLFHSITSNHYTKVLITAKSIESVSSDTNLLLDENADNKPKEDNELRRLTECLKVKAQSGQYSYYDGGKSARKLLEDECADEYHGYIVECMKGGVGRNQCIFSAAGGAQVILGLLNK